MRTWLLLFIGLLTTAVLGCSNDGAAQNESAVDVQSALRTVIASSDDDAAHALYEQRSFRPAWVEARSAPERLREAVSLLCRANQHGLIRGDYVSAEFARAIELAYGEEHESDSVAARRLAELDVAVSRRLMELSEDLVDGRVDPREVGGTWKAPVREVDPVDLVAKAASRSDATILVDSIAGTHEQYAHLKEARRRYQAIALSGGFPTVASGPALSVGDEGARVSQVRRRLAASGDLDSTALDDSSTVFDESLAGAVRSFQERHGLKVDGVVGENVVDAMQVPVEQRMDDIALNMERWRWIPTHLGGRYIYVNIPAFQLRAFDQGEEKLFSKVVVGKQFDARTTPVFSDTMEYVVINPYWNIPHSIATQEILPTARDNPSYLAANNYEIVTGWGEGADVVPSSAHHLDLVASGDYRLRQEPGPDNSLGRIKFMFPNEFNIYLHDTPADHLFDRRTRAYSHGCVRVEREIDLASFVFNTDSWNASSVEDAIAARDRRVEYLSDPVPVYMLYWTSFVDDEGRLHFRDDIYGHDEDWRSALRQQQPDDPAITCRALQEPLTRTTSS